MKKYNILKPESAIKCFPNENCLVYGNKTDGYGICLKNNFLKINNNFGIALVNNFLKRNDNFENHKSRVYNVPSDICLSGENKFEVEEVEVYQILFE